MTAKQHQMNWYNEKNVIVSPHPMTIGEMATWLRKRYRAVRMVGSVTIWIDGKGDSITLTGKRG